MAGIGLSRDTARMVLMAIMAVALAVTLVVGTGALVWNEPPLGVTLTHVASVFAWIFAVAFLLTFAIAILEERENSRRRTGAHIARPHGHG